MNRRSLAGTVAVATMVVLWAAPVLAETLIMPRELVEHARQNGCDQVADFFDRVGTVGPPYVYGYLPGPEDGSAVLWCQRRVAGRRQFFLLIMTRNESQGVFDAARCPRRIEWTSGYPGGLAIIQSEAFLQEFRYLDAPGRPGPKGVRAAGPAIRTEFDGTGSLLYCHKGRWLLSKWD
jgi:hypothetical protein